VFEATHRPLVLAPDLVARVAAAYAEPQRAYHTARHIAEVLERFDEVATHVGWAMPREVYVAIVFHDAIYDPPAKDNEARSAAWAVQEGFPKRTADLIELTARHGKLTPNDVDRDEALFLDCDMAILAADPVRFAEYDRQIAFEYKHVPPEMYAIGRRAFLDGVLAKPRIFLSDYFHDRLDQRARENLRAH